MTPGALLLDSMIVIEAVRTGCFMAITGQRHVVTTPICEQELRQGNQVRRGYVPVTDQHLSRVGIEAVSELADAALRLRYPDVDGLDPGERELIALAVSRTDDFQLCSCDKAAVRAAHQLGLLNRVVSLEGIARAVGARVNPSLRTQFTEARLAEWRTKLELGGLN